jgi:hypothetical protein
VRKWKSVGEEGLATCESAGGQTLSGGECEGCCGESYSVEQIRERGGGKSGRRGIHRIHGQLRWSAVMCGG